MHILSIHNSSAFGGAERYTVDLLSGLAGRGHKVTFAGPSGSPTFMELKGSGVSVDHVPMGLAIGWHSVLGPLNEPLFWVDLYANPLRSRVRRHVQRIHDRDPIDVVHVQFIKERLWLGKVARSLGIPVVWTIHSPLEPWMERGVARRVMRTEAVNVNRIIAVSSATAASLVASGIGEDRIDVVYNGLDMALWSTGDRQATRALLGLGEEVAVLVPARPHHEKGIGVLLDAAELLAGRDQGAFTFFVAGGSRHIPHYQDDIDRRGLREHVRLLGHRDDMTDLYDAADIVCLPSFYEGLPYAISEGMAAGKPVVATSVGGVPEMIGPECGGLLIEPGDPMALADACVALRDPSEREAMGAAGRRRAEELFSMEAMLEGSERVLARVVARGAANRGSSR